MSPGPGPLTCCFTPRMPPESPNYAERRQQQPIRSTIPVRLDRLRWTLFHTRLITGPGRLPILPAPATVRWVSTLTPRRRRGGR